MTTAAEVGDIRGAIDVLLESGAVTELRILDSPQGTLAGFFSDRDALAEAAAQYDGKAPGIFIIPNVVNPRLLGRAANRLKRVKPDESTTDKQILRRRWIYIDVDPTGERPAGVSSTDAEHAAALGLAREIRAWLIERGWPGAAFVLADSGNGGHLLARVDLPNDDVSRTLVQRALQALSLHFTTTTLAVDVAVVNAARIWKTYGTIAAKGDALPGAPHRRARLLDVPTELTIVPPALLAALAAEAPETPGPESGRSTGRSPFDIEAWIAEHGLSVVRRGAWDGSGAKWILRPCPFNPEHTNGSAYILRFANGAIAAGCHHNGCAGRRWPDLRNLLESGWQDRRATPTAAEAPRARIGTPWDHALSAPEFLAGDETEAPFLVPRLLARGAITEVFSPRGLGKTNVVHAHLVELARAGLRVLLIDRDNPRREIKRRLRAWHADVAPSLKIIGREHAPPLTDTEAWAAFPMDTYDVVAIDSLDASAEGVGEGDSAKPSRAFAVVLDLARRRDGPAIIVLGNVIKSGAHSRGSGVIEDRADISYEVRDATGLRPSGTRDWWHELPPSSVADWALRASRRTRRDVYRLAFVPSKFRLGEEPEPFVFEVDHRPDPWALRDVTRDLLAAGEAARTQAEHHRAETLAAATERLADEIASREDTGEPMILGNAEAFLRAAGLTRKAARDLLAAEDGRRWSRVPGAGKGAPVHFRRGPLFSSGKTSRTSAAKIPGENPTPTTQNPERPIYADRMDTGRRKSPPHQTRINGGDSTPPISPAAGISLPPAEDTDSTAEMPNTGPEDDEEIAL